jgi:hypothetical protein
MTGHQPHTKTHWSGASCIVALPGAVCERLHEVLTSIALPAAAEDPGDPLAEPAAVHDDWR